MKYIKEAHALAARYRLWDKPYMRFDELKALDDNYWGEFSALLLGNIPKTLYRYRPFNKNSLDELRNGYAWFSHPADFDDVTDSALKTDIESEMKEIVESPEKTILSLTRAILLKQYRLFTGQEPDDKFIEYAIKFCPDGKLDVNAMRNALVEFCPDVNPEPFISMLTHFNESDAMHSIEQPLKEMFEYYMGMNKEIRSNLLCLCLTEEKHSDAMWAKYAGERSGFCIGYEIPASSFLGQKNFNGNQPHYLWE